MSGIRIFVNTSTVDVYTKDEANGNLSMLTPNQPNTGDVVLFFNIVRDQIRYFKIESIEKNKKKGFDCKGYFAYYPILNLNAKKIGCKKISRIISQTRNAAKR